MRVVLIAILAAAGNGQILLDPARVPEEFRRLDQPPASDSLRCKVVPIQPALDFSFRFQSGYVLRVPMNQYSGPRHQWAVIVRIAPDSGGSPVYLGARYPLPNVPKTQIVLEMGGAFLVGAGSYHVQWQMYDETGRSCHAAWTIRAGLSHSDRDVKMAIEPGTVRAISSPVRSRNLPAAEEEREFPVTILLHAAPLSLRRTWLSGRDRVMLLGMLSSLIERLHTHPVRVVVFSLDQQKEIYRDEHFGRRKLADVSRALNSLELGKVDVSILEKPRGHVDLLANLVRREMTAAQTPVAVLILGPECRFLTSPSASELDKPVGPLPHFYYLEYTPSRIAHASLPDSIAGAVHKLKGKTMVIRTPADFAKAIQQVERSSETN